MDFIAFHLIFYLFFIPPLISGADTLVVNQSLSGNQTLISLAGNFEMGFFKPGKLPNYYIGIWYKNIKTLTVVWVANRETPIHDRFSSKLKVQDGNLVLVNESNTPVWSTNLITTDKHASVVLLDDGNLVLRYESSSSPPIWQSFDHPTHTFLPGNKLGYNKHTNTTQVMTSWRSREDPGVGLFSFEIVQQEKKYVLKWNRSVEYWSSGSWNGEFFSLIPEMRVPYVFSFNYIDNANESYFTYSFNDPSIISRLVIDVSGQIQQLTWMENSQEWYLFWSRPQKVCDVYAKCGTFSICNEQILPSCNCLIGFEPASWRDWNLSEFSGGCVRKTELKCRIKEENPGFITSYVPVNFLPTFYENKTLSLDESACRRSCLDDCSCDGYSFIDKTCRLWKSENLNSISLVFVSNDFNVEKFELNVKVASKDLQHPIKNTRYKKNDKVNLGVVIGSVIGVVLVLALALFIIYRKKRLVVGKTKMEGSLVAFVYRDLQRATKNFSEKLGSGGFGSVFKGVLHDSSIVAVKKLESVSQGEKQFRSEVSTIGTTQHVNLVRLRGFCAQGSSKLLVYDYMPNGSLDFHLFHKGLDSVLNWKTRYEIAVGIARGLVYLHEKCRDCIIHCDIKPENILLDADFCPKVADFGLAKLVGRDFSRVLTTMRGTRGYLAPEWLSGVPITAKADVFSYGMMLFELVHGKRNSEQFQGSVFTFFPSLAANVVMGGGDILSLLDSRLNREASVEEVTKVCKVAYWCIQDEEHDRPSMSQVEHILEGVVEVKMPPIPQSVKFFIDDDMEDVPFFAASSSIFNESSSTGSSQVHTSSLSGD
ncbi:hypothetical protein SSX86_028642 [Deinandra increscens subsp. villosa]|uniref:Receptor-like serine/threonine-protein kinase n=1 Tax=Deinandra increscens subsp. villosa TaxID=3103831 RepID=A0AAP0CEU1_9ASTR